MARSWDKHVQRYRYPATIGGSSGGVGVIMRLSRCGWGGGIIREVGLGSNGVEQKVDEMLCFYKSAKHPMTV